MLTGGEFTATFYVQTPEIGKQVYFPLKLA